MGKFSKALFSGIIAGTIASLLIGPEAGIMAFLAWFIGFYLSSEKKVNRSSATHMNRFNVPEEKRCSNCGGTMYHGKGNKKWHCSKCKYKEDYY